LPDVIFFPCNYFWLNSDQTLFKKFHKLFRILVKSRPFIRKVVQELKQINLNIIMQHWISFHDNLLYLFLIVFLKKTTNRNHELFQTITVFLNPLLLSRQRIIKRSLNRLLNNRMFIILSVHVIVILTLLIIESLRNLWASIIVHWSMDLLII
jgi:hypothetical protein